MTSLKSILDVDNLDRHIDAGRIRRQTHEGMSIYTYTPGAVYERAWDHETMTCRGLVVSDDGEVLARPFPKFFNHNEPSAPQIPLDDFVTVTDKVDGSLGILVPHGDGHIIVTKGSFTSPQALWATKKWKETYEGKFHPQPGWTYLFEIIHPDNRIVLDYAGMEDLVLLGAVGRATGRTIHPEAAAYGWPGPAARQFVFNSYGEALSAPPRPNAEGYVVYHPKSDQRVKIKQQDYLELHKIATGLNEKVVWQMLVDGRDPREAAATFPDEWMSWVDKTATDFEEKFGQIFGQVLREHLIITKVLPASRKELAAAFLASPIDSSLLFLMHDEQYDRLDEKIWKSLKPSGKMATFNSWGVSDE